MQKMEEMQAVEARVDTQDAVPVLGQTTKKRNRWKEVLFSSTLMQQGISHKLAYIAICIALNIVTNSFTSIPLGIVQFSFTLSVVALTGILIGPLFGFATCFLGDTVGFFINPSGPVWSPWVGLSMGIAALIAGFVVNGLPFRFKGAIYVKLTIVCLLTFVICTYGINTTAGFFLWNSKGLPYGTFLAARLPVQLVNNLLNALLLYLIVPILGRIKFFKVCL